VKRMVLELGLDQPTSWLAWSTMPPVQKNRCASWAISRLNSFCLSGVSRDTGSMPMDWQYSLASCCSKSLHPNFQVTTNPFPFQKWLGAWAAHLAVPPTIWLEDEEKAGEEATGCLTAWGWG